MNRHEVINENCIGDNQTDNWRKIEDHEIRELQYNAERCTGPANMTSYIIQEGGVLS